MTRTREKWLEEYGYKGQTPASLQEALEWTLHQWTGLREENRGGWCTAALKIRSKCPLCTFFQVHGPRGCVACPATRLGAPFTYTCTDRSEYQLMVHCDDPIPGIELIKKWLDAEKAKNHKGEHK